MFGKKKKGRVKLDMSFEDAIDKALNTPISKLPEFKTSPVIERTDFKGLKQDEINVLQTMLSDFSHEINQHKGVLHAEMKNGMDLSWGISNIPEELWTRIQIAIDVNGL